MQRDLTEIKELAEQMRRDKPVAGEKTAPIVRPTPKQ
jgi:hypothetical protein